VSEQAAQRTIVEACNVLGQNYKGAQKAWYKSNIYPDCYMWFTKFYINKQWDNSISTDRK
jgi:hypothetical protein